MAERPSVGTRDKSVSWYTERPSDSQIGPDARRLLESYSHVPADEVFDHIVKVRETAWEIFPYPCIGQFRFLDLSLRKREEYQEVLDRLSQGQLLLDMACCFGQEIRQLVADGAPSENIYGCDLRPEYVDLGYELFADRVRLGSHFFAADIFADPSPLTTLRGTFDMVYAGSFFHLFDYEDQVKTSILVTKLLKPQRGSLILGRQIGAVKADDRNHRTNPNRKMYMHNPESLQKMWAAIGEELGLAFSVQAHLHELEGVRDFHDSNTKRIQFAIRWE